jgi:chaperonin GroES
MSKKAPIKFRPLHDKVLVRPDPPEKVIQGIIIPDKALEKADRGTVLAVGPGRFWKDAGFVATVLKPGQRVIYGRHPSWELDGEELVVIQESEVISLLEDEAPEQK